jgi:GntR family transcriptional regulator
MTRLKIIPTNGRVRASHSLKVPTLIDRGSPLPLHYQLRQILLHRVQQGDIAPSGVFPSEKELQDEFSLSRITVRRALGDLAQEGLIYRQPGRGTFLLRSKLEPSSEKLGGLLEELAAKGYRVKSQILAVDRRPVPHGIAQKLHVQKGERLFYLARLVFANGEPISLSTSYFKLGEEIILTRKELEGASVFPLLEDKYGIFLRRADKTIEATLPLNYEAELLHIKPSTPLLLTQLIAYDSQGQPAAFVKAIYRGDRYKYHTKVTR